jgi:nitrogen fixation/metabolism regulation signal transduction histidine kinase
MRVYRKIVIYSLLAMLVPLVAVSIVFFQRMRSTVVDQFAESYRNILRQQVDSVRSQAASRLALLDQIAASSILREVLVRADVLDSGLFELSGKFDQFVGSATAPARQPDVYQVTVYSGRHKAALASNHIVTYDEADELVWPEGQRYQIGKALVVPSTSKGLGRQCISPQ